MTADVRREVKKVILDNDSFIEPAKELIQNELQALKIEYYNNVPPERNAAWKAKRVLIDVLEEVLINLKAGDSEGFINAWGNFKFVVSEFDIVKTFFSENLSVKARLSVSTVEQTIIAWMLLRKAIENIYSVVSSFDSAVPNSVLPEKEKLLHTCEEVSKNLTKDSELLVNTLREYKSIFPRPNRLSKFFAKISPSRNSLFIQEVAVLAGDEKVLNYLKEINQNPDQNSPYSFNF